VRPGEDEVTEPEDISFPSPVLPTEGQHFLADAASGQEEKRKGAKGEAREERESG